MKEKNSDQLGIHCKHVVVAVYLHASVRKVVPVTGFPVNTCSLLYCQTIKECTDSRLSHVSHKFLLS